MNSSFVIRLWAVAGAAFLSISGANAQSNENGYGADPDGDTNPATMTRAVANIGATDVRLDPRFTIVTFEPPPGAHNKPIKDFLAPRYGVGFSKGLRWQICDDQRYYQYDSLCTYIRPPSGSYAAYYRDDLKRPLHVTFDTGPVCGVVLSVYPPGGKEGEIFKVTLDAKKEDGSPAGKGESRIRLDAGHVPLARDGGRLLPQGPGGEHGRHCRAREGSGRRLSVPDRRSRLCDGKLRRSLRTNSRCRGICRIGRRRDRGCSLNNH
ncbi:MAG TPA: hypothetical protein PKH09_08440 [Parvularculaceae bacterium]|nr:hypothetical protein [Parvularculaceae bacterium]